MHAFGHAILRRTLALALFSSANLLADDRPGSQTVRNHDAVAAAQLVAGKKKAKQDLVILDVRTPGEFKRGHLEHAKLLDFNSRDFAKELAKLDRKKAYLVYCAVGGRSSRARDAMKKLGFLEIHHLDGGFRAWTAAKLPTKK